MEDMIAAQIAAIKSQEAEMAKMRIALETELRKDLNDEIEKEEKREAAARQAAEDQLREAIKAELGLKREAIKAELKAKREAIKDTKEQAAKAAEDESFTPSTKRTGRKAARAARRKVALAAAIAAGFSTIRDHKEFLRKKAAAEVEAAKRSAALEEAKSSGGVTVADYKAAATALNNIVQRNKGTSWDANWKNKPAATKAWNVISGVLPERTANGSVLDKLRKAAIPLHAVADGWTTFEFHPRFVTMRTICYCRDILNTLSGRR
jgi:hypothetical protein